MGEGRVTGSKFAGGSSWSSAYIYTTASGRRLFVKTALGRDPEAMFRGEAEGLKAMHGACTGTGRCDDVAAVAAQHTLPGLHPEAASLPLLIPPLPIAAATRTIRVPEVFHYGPLPAPPGGGALRRGGSFIVMEYLDLSGRCDQAELGRQVARMHLAPPQHDHAAQFGFACDNTIGGTPVGCGAGAPWALLRPAGRLCRRHAAFTLPPPLPLLLPAVAAAAATQPVDRKLGGLFPGAPAAAPAAAG